MLYAKHVGNHGILLVNNRLWKVSSIFIRNGMNQHTFSYPEEDDLI